MSLLPMGRTKDEKVEAGKGRRVLRSVSDLFALIFMVLPLDFISFVQ
jgi:hypothetical protein